MKTVLRFIIAGTALFGPLAAFAAAAGTVQDVLHNVGKVINTATPIVVALALLGFFWGLALYVFGTSNDDKRKKGLSVMVWGVIALFVMLSVFGIVNIIQNTLGVQQGSVTVPVLQ